MNLYITSLYINRLFFISNKAIFSLHDALRLSRISLQDLGPDTDPFLCLRKRVPEFFKQHRFLPITQKSSGETQVKWSQLIVASHKVWHSSGVSLFQKYGCNNVDASRTGCAVV